MTKTIKHFINLYDPVRGEYSSRFSRTIFAVKLSKIIDMIFKNRATHFFNDPKYNDIFVFTSYMSDHDRGFTDITQYSYSIDIAKTMPTNSIGWFLCEILKIFCASLYIDGSRCRILFNEDIISDPVTINWSDKLSEDITVRIEKGVKYSVGYSGAERTYKKVDSYSGQNNHLSEFPEGYTLVANTGDMIQCQMKETSDGTETKEVYKVYSTEYLNIGATEDVGSDGFACECNITPISMGIYTYMERKSNTKIIHRWLLPELSLSKDKFNLNLGMYKGMQKTSDSTHSYPYMTYHNFAMDGTKIGDLSLSFNHEDGVKAYHNKFSWWHLKDKKVITGNVLLSLEELRSLDISKKIFFKDRAFFIKSIAFSIVSGIDIEPSEVELVEAL